MAYNHLLVFARLDKLLSTNPRLTLREIAQILGIGTRTLRSVVKEAKGKSFREHQKDIILERSRYLLDNEPGILKKQVAAALGYSSPDSLSRLLKGTIRKAAAKTRREDALPLLTAWRW